MTKKRPQLSMYSRQQIATLIKEGVSTTAIVEKLEKEIVSTCRQTVWHIANHGNRSGTENKVFYCLGRSTKIFDFHSIRFLMRLQISYRYFQVPHLEVYIMYSSTLDED